MHGTMCDYTDDCRAGPAHLAIRGAPSFYLLFTSQYFLKPSMTPFQTFQVEVVVSPEIFSQLSMLTSFIYFFKIYFNWRLITLQYCSGLSESPSVVSDPL